MPELLRYSVPIPIVCGAGALGELRAVAQKCGMARPLLMTYAGLVQAGLVERARAALGPLAKSGEVFDTIAAPPTEADVLAALERYRSAGCDGIIAFGGGSTIDCAKAVGLLASHPGTVTDYDFLQGGLQRITQPIPPLVAVPTTAGTGSEVSRGALIITRRGDLVRKTLVASPRLVPAWALLDAELTVGMPPALTAGTGMDALSHAVEECSSPRYHPVVAAIAFEALRRLARDLPRVMHEPGNLALRSDMLISAMMGGIGFEKGLGAVHSLSHAIDGLHTLHHGTLNAVILPACLEFNRGHFQPGVALEMARAAGLSLRGASDGEAVDALARWVRALNAELGLPARLRDMGIPAEHRAPLIELTLKDHCHLTNPRPCTRESLQELWERAW